MSNGLSTLLQPVTYSLIFTNNSGNSWDFCCYQKDPEENYKSVAWFVAPTVHPTTTIIFTWEISYALTWARTGILNPGILYVASQSWTVDPNSNAVTLAKKEGSYTFQDQKKEDPISSYIIHQDHTLVKQDGVAIGIAMKISSNSGGYSGFSPVYAQSAQPNIDTSFSITPNYWVVFKQKIKPNQILSVDNMTNSYQIIFEEGVYTKSVVLDSQNNWQDSTLQQANEAFIKHKKGLVLLEPSHWGY